MTHVLFAFAPTMDTHDRFFNCYPSSLLHAVAPLVDAIDTGRLDASYSRRLYHPKVFTAAAKNLWLEMLRRERPSHIAISSTYDSWHVALYLGRVARSLLSDVVIVHGGPYLDEVLEPFVLKRTPSLDPLTADLDSYVDFLVGGDGEYPLLWLIRVTADVDSHDAARETVAHRAGEIPSLPGVGHIVFRDSGVRRSVKFRNRLDLDALPFVPRHLLPVEDLYDFDCFTNDEGSRRPTVTMITHRGCLARCNFCSEGLPYQARSHAQILREAVQLRASGVEAIFLDDSTIQDDPHLEHLFDGFHEFGFEVGALTRFDQIQDRDALRRLRDRGLVYLYASVEQYSNHSLDKMHKRLRIEQVDRGIKNCDDLGIRLGVSLLFGLPYETRQSVEATLDYAALLRDRDLVDYISMSLFSYHPKTPLAQMNRDVMEGFDFSQMPPNLHAPFTGFEEGSWYHPGHVTADYAGRILDVARARFGDRLVRELAKHRGSIPGPVRR